MQAVPSMWRSVSPGNTTIALVSMEKLRSKLQNYKYDEDKQGATYKVTKPTKSTRKIPPAIKNDISSELKDLPPSHTTDQILMFIGYNPGIESSRQQHHYAHFSNLFWKLFNQSKILLRVLEVIEVDKDELLEKLIVGTDTFVKPEHDYDLTNYKIGFTDLVLRCTKTAQELDMNEKLRNVPRLLEEFGHTNSKMIVFIGKGIWEIVVKFMGQQIGVRAKLTKSNFQWGLQTENTGNSADERTYNTILKRFRQLIPTHSRVYVFPNTSGLVGSLKYDEKLKLWTDLADDIGRC